MKVCKVWPPRQKILGTALSMVSYQIKILSEQLSVHGESYDILHEQKLLKGNNFITSLNQDNYVCSI